MNDELVHTLVEIAGGISLIFLIGGLNSPLWRRLRLQFIVCLIVRGLIDEQQPQLLPSYAFMVLLAAVLRVGDEIVRRR